MKLFTPFLLVAALALPCIHAYPWEPCSILPMPNCSCWDPDFPCVSCSYMDLTEIPQSNTLGEAETITRLDFSNNDLRSIPDGALQHFRTQILDLSYNRDLELSSQSFAGLEASLSSLNLRDVNMRNTPPNIFGPLRNLRELDLSDNQLIRVANLRPLLNLKRLLLSGNKIVSWELNAFADSVELEELDITLKSYNKVDCLRRVAQMGGDSITFLKVLRVSQCNMRFRQASMWKFPHLQALSLQHCNIMDSDVVSPFLLAAVENSLTSLDLSNNFLESIPVSLIQPLDKLEHLDLSRNLITSFIFPDPPLPSLTYLDLADNRITTIPSAPLRRLSGLTYLALDRNHLSTLSAYIHQPGLELSLSGNPLVCDCRLNWMVNLAGQEVEGGQPGPLSLHDIYTGIQCEGGFQGMSLSELYNTALYHTMCSDA